MYLIELKDVLIQITLRQLVKDDGLISGMRDHIGIAAVNETMREHPFLLKQASMRHHLRERERKHPILPFAACKRLVDLVGQIERGTSRGDKLHIGHLIRHQFQLDTYIGDTLGLINDKNVSVSHNSPKPCC